MFNKSKLKTKTFDSVKSIPQPYWDSLACSNNIYYSPEFLEAFELGNDDIGFNYIVIVRDGKAIAFANTQLVTIGVETITKNIKLKSWLKRIINNMFCNNEIRVLFCGNVFLSGEYSTFLKDGEEKIETFEALATGIERLKKRTRRLHALFVKDFLDESIYITKHLSNFDYLPMHVEPNMIIHLKPEWQSFDDYKSALKSKYRIKANKADSKSEVLVAKTFSKEDIQCHQKALQTLYQYTIANADFNAQVLNLKTYSYLKERFPKNFYVKGYFYDDSLVGFLSAMKNGNNLDAHFIGIDYTKNRALAIYPRILNDYVRLGIETMAKRINLGRTASEIKSTLGAVPETLTCYFKHPKKTINAFMKPFIKNVTIKTFKQHEPFK